MLKTLFKFSTLCLCALTALSNLHAADSDDDGFTDAIEIYRGTNPNDDADFPPSGQVTIWPAIPAGYHASAVDVATENGQFVVLGINGQVASFSANGTIENTDFLSDIVAVEAGVNFRLALDTQGRIHAWGTNGSVISSTPTDTGYRQIFAGVNYAMALKEDGTLVGWGPDYPAPTSDHQALKYRRVTAGLGFVVGLTSEGQVVAWGINTYGQTNVPANLTDVVDLAAGLSHTIALLGNGEIRSWGNDVNGSLNIPPSTSAVKIAANLFSSMYAQEDNQVVVWNNLTLSDTPSFQLPIIDMDLGVSHAAVISNSGPVVVDTPFSHLEVEIGESFRLYALAEQYDRAIWRHEGEIIEGANTLEYIDPSFSSADAGQYEIEVFIGDTSARRFFTVTGIGAPVIRVNGLTTYRSAAPATISMSTTIPNGLIFYTLDGTSPNPTKNVYATQFSLNSSALIRARTYTQDFANYLDAEPVQLEIVPAYTISLGNGSVGSAIKSPNKSTYLENDTVQITATPSSGWKFVRWTGSLAGEPSSTHIQVTANIVSTPVFGADVDVSATPGGSYARTLPNPVEYNSNLSLTAIPQTGFSFLYWRKNGVTHSASPTISVRVNEPNLAYQAVFFQAFELPNSVDVGLHEHGSISGAGEYDDGELATIQATPNLGYVFVDWVGKFAGKANPYTFQPEGAETVQAIFAPDTRDFDGDTLTNYEELIIYGTKIDDPDSDSDKIRDDHEIALSKYLDPNEDNSDLLALVNQYAPELGLTPISELIEIRGFMEPQTTQFDGTFALEFWLSESSDLNTWTPAPLDRLTYQLRPDGSLLIYLESDSNRRFARLHGAPQSDAPRLFNTSQ